jgi:hypothetical protein
MPIGSIAQDAQHAALRSKELGDRLEIGQGLRVPVAGPSRNVQAMVDVIPDQGPFRLGDRLLHGMELLGDLGTAPAVLDHRDDAEEMPVRPLQTLDDVAVGCMSMRFCHT